MPGRRCEFAASVARATRGAPTFGGGRFAFLLFAVASAIALLGDAAAEDGPLRRLPPIDAAPVRLASPDGAFRGGSSASPGSDPSAVPRPDSPTYGEGSVSPVRWDPSDPSWGNQHDLESSPPDDGLQNVGDWLGRTRVGYDRGFVVASDGPVDLQSGDSPFLLRVNGLLQLRQTRFDSEGPDRDLNQFQLIRGRLAFSGHALTSDLGYFIQLDGRSSAGDEFRLLDYIMDFDFGRHLWGLERRTLVFKAGKYKVPFTLARYLSAREFQFSDRSMASMYFDVNRSLAWGLYGQGAVADRPFEWETALFNGLVTGGAETGSSGTLDNNFAYSARLAAYPTGEWGAGALSDFDIHEQLATRIGCAYVGSRIDRLGETEFNSIRVVDSGERLAPLLPAGVDAYDVHMYCVDASCKLRGWSVTSEYYFRVLNRFEGGAVPDLFDHGFWLQVGKFVVPERLELLARWSRVTGDSGSLGLTEESADEVAGGFVWYFHGQNARLTFDATHLNGAPISASSLDIFPGDRGWLFRTQIQFAF